MKQCWGLKRNLTRCQRTGDWRLFCDEHKRQPLVGLFILLFTVIAGSASIYSCAFRPESARQAQEKEQREREAEATQMARIIAATVTSDLQISIPVAQGMRARIIERKSVIDPSLFASLYSPSVNLPGAGETAILHPDVIGALDSYRRLLSECNKHRQTYIDLLKGDPDEFKCRGALTTYCIGLDSVVRSGLILLRTLHEHHSASGADVSGLPSYRLIEEDMPDIQKALLEEPNK